MKNHVITKSYDLKKTRTAILLISAITILGLFSIDSSYASGFLQSARIHIDKGSFNLGDYQIVLTDTDTGNYLTKSYTDSSFSPQNLVTVWTIPTFDGDTLQACLTKISTNEATCDYRTANSGLFELNFYLNWANRIVV
jgi:hypothetical protein